MSFLVKAVRGFFCLGLLLPVLMFAQAADDVIFNYDATLEEAGLEAPDFLEGIQTEEDWDALTSEQRAQAELFLQSIGPSLSQGAPADLEGVVSCFDHYTFGSVKVNVQGVLASTVSGVPFAFTGSLDNENSYPVVDGAVYMKIFRLPDDGSTPVNGYDVVYQGFVEENLSLKADSQTPVSFEWDIPAALPSGQYQAAFFFTSAKRFNLLGLPFTDDVVGNTVSFTVVGELSKTIAFQKDAVTINDEPYYFAAFTPKVDQTKPIAVAAVLRNDTGADEEVLVTITTYAWDQQRQENVIDTKTVQVVVPAGTAVPVSQEVTDVSSSVYLVVFEAAYLDVKSVLNVRFTRSNLPSVRINFPAVTSYPLKAGEETTLFSCLHAAGTLSLVEDGQLTLTLKDEKGDLFHSYEYRGGITGDMMGVAEIFTPERDYTQFTLTADLYRNGELIDSVDMLYGCAALGAECPQPESVVSVEADSGSNPLIELFAMAIIFVALLAILFKILFKDTPEMETHKPDDLGSSNGPSSMGPILLLLVCGSFAFGGSPAEAKSVIWNSPVLPPLAYYWANIHSAWQTPAMTPSAVGCVRPGPGGCGFELALENAMASVTYKAQAYDHVTGNVLTDGQIVPVGSKIRVHEIPKVNTDISWFGTGYSSDSPYGRWVAAAGPLMNVGCSSGDYTGTVNLILVEDPIHTYNMLHVDPKAPQVLPRTSNLSCDVSGVCDVTATGPISLSVKFPETVGRFYHRYVGKIWGNWICGGNNVPLRTYTADEFSFTYLGVRYTFYSNIVPNSDDYFLQIPEQTIDFAFNAVSVSENEEPLPPVVTTLPGSNHMILSPQSFDVIGTDPDDDTIRYEVDWDMDGVADQLLPAVGYVPSGTNVSTNRSWVTSGTKLFQVRTVDENAAYSEWTQHDIVLCDLGYTWDGAICQPPQPDLIPYASISPLTVFDTTLGVYPQVVIEYSIENNGDVQVDEASENYIGLDRNADNSYAIADEKYDTIDFGAAPLLVGSVSAPKTVVVATNVPLGTHTILIDVDHDDSISETNETNNRRTLTLTAPAPILTLNVSDNFVRTGTTAVLTWGVSSTYLANCAIKGPGVDVVINPSIDGSSGSISTGVIGAKSEYVFSCTDAVGTYSVDAIVETTGSVEEI